jgi:hypothetical protein
LNTGNALFKTWRSSCDNDDDEEATLMSIRRSTCLIISYRAF